MTNTPDMKVSRHLEQVAIELNKTLRAVAGQRMQFSLLVFSDNPGARTNYISNCQREDVIKAMKELIENWERDMPDIPAHKLDS